jgi:hypothetical protein
MRYKPCRDRTWGRSVSKESQDVLAKYPAQKVLSGNGRIAHDAIKQVWGNIYLKIQNPRDSIRLSLDRKIHD